MNICTLTCDIYWWPFSVSADADTAQIDKAKEVIKKLTFNFQSDAFENPGE